MKIKHSRIIFSILLAAASVGMYAVWHLVFWKRVDYTLDIKEMIIFKVYNRRDVMFSFFCLFLCLVSMVTAIISYFLAIWTASAKMRQVLINRTLLVLVSAGFSLITLELAARKIAPPWPARDLRPYRWDNKGFSELNESFNSWGLRDKERQIDKPEGVTRVLLLGDSFLEGGFCRKSLSCYTEEVLNSVGRSATECFNLGVSATGLAQYYYRYLSVGAYMKPDAVLCFFYSGNDFTTKHFDQRYERQLISERPIPSILGNAMPALTWVIVDRLGLSEYSRGNKRIPNEFNILKEIASRPYDNGVHSLAVHINRFYRNDLSLDEIELDLRKGGQSLWDCLGAKEQDREYLQGWRCASIVEGKSCVQEKHIGSSSNMSEDIADATASYLVALRNILDEQKIPLVVVLIPIADEVDPDYREFWSPWYNSTALGISRGEALSKLQELLNRKYIKTVDLRPVLTGIRGAYRKMDGHWTELGHSLVADTISQQIANLDYGKCRVNKR